MLQEVVTEDTTVGSNHFKATEDNPKVKVKSEKSGKEVSRCIPKMYSTCCAVRPTVGCGMLAARYMLRAFWPNCMLNARVSLHCSLITEDQQ